MRVKPFIAIPLIALALAGCSAQQPTLKETAAATEQKPLFATDEEALAAAQTAYANYLEVSDQIARDGGANPERLKGLVSESLYSEQISGYKDVQSQGLKATGASAFDTFNIQGITEDSVINYVCLRLSGIRVIDSRGTDVTPTGRNDDLPLQIEWKAVNSHLILDKSEVWTGQNFCL